MHQSSAGRLRQYKALTVVLSLFSNRKQLQRNIPPTLVKYVTLLPIIERYLLRIY